MSGYRPRGNARKMPDKQITVEQAKAQLTALLNSCRSERLAQFTVDNLSPMYRVPPREIECMLNVALRREREGTRC